MKRLLILLLVCSSVAFGQVGKRLTNMTKVQGDTVQASVLIAPGFSPNSLAGYPWDSTGISLLKRPIFVLQGDSVWVPQEGIAVGTESGQIAVRIGQDSLGTLSTVRYNDTVGVITRSAAGTIRHIQVYDVNDDGNITTELQNAINLAPAYTKIDVVGGEYDLDTSLTFPTVIPGSHGFLHINGNGTILKVRNGYTGCFIDQTIAMRRTTVEGFNVYEETTPDSVKRLWTAIRLVGQTAGDGHQWNLFRNMYFEDCGVGIDLRVDTSTSWINANQFVDIKVIRPNIMVRSRLPVGSSNWYLIDGNTFTRIEGQSKSNTVTAVDSMEGIYNSFYECTIYDLGEWNPSANAVAIGTKSASTLIWRGQLDYPRYLDRGSRTTFVSAYVGTEGIVTGMNKQTWNRIRVDNLYPTRKIVFGYDSIPNRSNPDGWTDEGQIFQDSVAGAVFVGKSGTVKDFTLLNNIDNKDTVLSIKHAGTNTYLHGDLRIKGSASNNPEIWFDSLGTPKWHIGYTMSTNKFSIVDSSAVRMQFDQGGSVAWVATHYWATDSTYDIGFNGANRPRNLYVAETIKPKSLSGGIWLRGSGSFSTTSVRAAVYIAGATSSDIYVVCPISADGTTVPSPNDLCAPFAKTDSLIVIRPAGTTSGLGFNYVRVK